MRRRLSEPFGKAGLTVAILALVVGMAGGAYAAGGFSKSQEKQISKIAQKEAKKYAGKPGTNGATGPAGPAGTAGANGKDGTNGTNGTAGTNGTNGKSVTIGATAPGCAAGGHTIEVAGEPATKQNVCNGEEGSPWTELGTLPKGQAETGAWGFSPLPKSLGSLKMKLPISFPIPLAAPLEDSPNCGLTGEPACKVHVVGIGQEGPAECAQGTAEAPAAEPGNLCIYIQFGENSSHASEELEAGDLVTSSPETAEPGAGRAGAILSSHVLLPEGAYGSGVWVLRAPEGP